MTDIPNTLPMKREQFVINTLTQADLYSALCKGCSDFAVVPTYLVLAALISILDDTDVVADADVGQLHLTLSANAVCPLGKCDRAMLLMFETRGRTRDLHMSDVEAGRNITCKSIISVHCDCTYQSVAMTRCLALRDDHTLRLYGVNATTRDRQIRNAFDQDIALGAQPDHDLGSFNLSQTKPLEREVLLRDLRWRRRLAHFARSVNAFDHHG